MESSCYQFTYIYKKICEEWSLRRKLTRYKLKWMRVTLIKTGIPTNPECLGIECIIAGYHRCYLGAKYCLGRAGYRLRIAHPHYFTQQVRYQIMLEHLRIVL